MSDTEKRLAKQFARAIKDHERRSDYGGTHGQVIRNFKEQVWVWAPYPGFKMPDGTRTAEFGKAVDAWAEAN
jgi:hypothetical protein